MKNSPKQFLLISLLFAVLPVSGMDEADSELSHRSEWWPDKVTVLNPVIGPLNGQVVKPGRQGFVVRLVGEDVLIDFGRYGVVMVPITETDFIDKSLELRSKREWSDMGIWTAQLHTKLMKRNEFAFNPVPIATFDPIEYFVIVYLDSRTAEGQAILAWMRDSDAIKHLPENYCLVLIPADQNVQDYHLELSAYEYPGLTLTFPLADPYRKILNQDPGIAAFAVIDKNGREISPAVALEQSTDFETLFDKLQRRISKDEEFRKTISVSE